MDEFKEEMVHRFRSMTEEEQKLFLYMCIDSFFEMQDKFNTLTDEADRRVAQVQMETYMFIINLFNYPAECLREQGYDNRRIVFKYVKEKYDEFIGKEIGNA